LICCICVFGVFVVKHLYNICIFLIIKNAIISYEKVNNCILLRKYFGLV